MLKEGAVKLQTLHDTQQGATSNVIPLVDATRSRPSGRVPVESRARRGKIGRGVRGKASTSEGEIMVGRDGIEPLIPGFSSPSPRSV